VPRARRRVQGKMWRVVATCSSLLPELNPSIPPLLHVDEPQPFGFHSGGENSPYLILCDHAANRIPRALGSLGLSATDLERHIGWDIGALGLARELASLLEACLVWQNYSRLVIDCNRPVESPESIAQKSEDTLIPGNHAVTPAEARLRRAAIFEPYHARISRELDERQARGQKSVLVFVHTFTPVFRGVSRPWHAGVLYLNDGRLARPLMARLQEEGEFHIGDNAPYAASALTDYSLVEHAERRGHRYIEIEVRQDLVTSEAGQKEWAHLWARLLEESIVFPA
jgi:predicted N-formylglutamate amidohydrolase